MTDRVLERLVENPTPIQPDGKYLTFRTLLPRLKSGYPRERRFGLHRHTLARIARVTYIHDDDCLVTSRAFLARSMLRFLAGVRLARDCWLQFFNRKGINMHYLSVTKKSLFSAAVCA